VRFPDGTVDEYHYVDEAPAVVILPFTAEGDVVAIEEWRQAVGRVNHGLPAGSVEDADGDDLVDAAARELAEETGYTADSFEHLTTVEPTNGMANAVHHHFVAHGCRPTGERDLDDNESIRVSVVGYDRLLSAAIDGDLRDGRAVTALLYYELISR